LTLVLWIPGISSFHAKSYIMDLHNDNYFIAARQLYNYNKISRSLAFAEMAVYVRLLEDDGVIEFKN
jgi:hypothetical protein